MLWSVLSDPALPWVPQASSGWSHWSRNRDGEGRGDVLHTLQNLVNSVLRVVSHPCWGESVLGETEVRRWSLLRDERFCRPSRRCKVSGLQVTRWSPLASVVFGEKSDEELQVRHHHVMVHCSKKLWNVTGRVKETIEIGKKIKHCQNNGAANFI